MTINRTTIALTQGLERPLLGPGVASLGPAAGRRIALVLAVAAILVLVAF